MKRLDKGILIGLFAVSLGAVITYNYLDAATAAKNVSLVSNSNDAAPAPMGDPATAQKASPLTSGNANAPDNETASIDDTSLFTQDDPNDDYATFGDRVQEIQARRHGQPVDAKALWNAMQQKQAWQPLAGTPDAPELNDIDRNDGREFIRINPLKIESLVAGDKLDITLAQTNKNYTVNIDNVQSDGGESVTWTGHLEGLESDNQVNITRGDTLIVAGITTPEGLFEMQTRGEEGWIASSTTMFKGVDLHLEVPPDAIGSTAAQPNDAHDHQHDNHNHNNHSHDHAVSGESAAPPAI